MQATSRTWGAGHCSFMQSPDVELASLDVEAVAAQARAEGLLNEEQLTALRKDVSRMQAQQRAERARNTMPLAELKAKLGNNK